MHNFDNSLENLPNSVAAIAPEPDELLGALDIVEAFTALRQELKLQVRNGRESQQMFGDSLLRIEQRLAAAQTIANAATLSAQPVENRKLAEAIADFDESLQRAVESLTDSAMKGQLEATWSGRFDVLIAQAPWLARKLAGHSFSQIRAVLADIEQEWQSRQTAHASVVQGFELVLARVRRQMQQCEIERVDVRFQPFDAELMNAIDLIDAPSVASSHVAEQLRPAYRWRGSLLRYAEVRLAK